VRNGSSTSFATTGSQPAQKKPRPRPPAPENKSMKRPRNGRARATWREFPVTQPAGMIVACIRRF
jgi:hypothetical protein